MIFILSFIFGEVVYISIAPKSQNNVTTAGRKNTNNSRLSRDPAQV